MKIWFQLLSSETGARGFIDSTQKHVDRALQPGTVVEVRGTTSGVTGDQYRLFWNYDQREVIDNGLRIRKEGGYDAFAVANSLDPGIVELREMLDIPVVSFMEVNCFHACTMGERFGIVAPSRKFVSRYAEIPVGYGLRDRLAAVEPILSDSGMEGTVQDAKAGDAMADQVIDAIRRCIAKGAEVVFIAGQRSALMAQRGVFEIDGVPLLDSFTLVAKYAELAVTMHRLTGVSVSRHLKYQAPPKELVAKVGHAMGVDALKNG